MRISPISRVDSYSRVSYVSRLEGLNNEKRLKNIENRERDKKKALIKRYVSYIRSIAKKFVADKKGVYGDTGLLEEEEVVGLNYDHRV